MSEAGSQQWISKLMPVLLWIIAGWRPSKGLQPWELLDSISAYYYTGAMVVFVGILVALGIFLITYRGYGNKYNLYDRLVGIIAGLAAIGAAFFPTEAPSCKLELSWWTSVTGDVHYICAAVLFCAFIVFSAFLFPKSKILKGEPMPSDKRTRNLLYRFFGAAMLVCMVWILIIWKYKLGSIFWPEAIALECFAGSWLLKGRVDYSLVSVWKKALSYARRP